jgi:hypothetical protein
MELDLIIKRCNTESKIEDSEVKQILSCLSYFMKQIVSKISTIGDEQQKYVHD